MECTKKEIQKNERQAQREREKERERQTQRKHITHRHARWERDKVKELGRKIKSVTKEWNEMKLDNNRQKEIRLDEALQFTNSFNVK